MSLLRALFPPPRTRLTWRTALPLIVFAGLYAGPLFAALVQGWMRFTWLPAFWLLLAAPWVWWLQLGDARGLTGWRAQAALQSRLWLVGIFVALLAEPRAVRKSDTISLVYALDVSDSMGQEVSDRSLHWIQKSVETKPAKDEAGLVVFGREAAVELPPRPTFPFESINSIVRKDGSDLAKGLRIAAAMLPEENQGRIVLISDGNQTDGQVLTAADEMKGRGIPVDVLQVNFDFKKEVWLERIDLPRIVKEGETYDAAVLLSALTPGKGKLRLVENERVILEKEVEYHAGKNRYALPLPQRGPGYYEYLATIEVPKGEDSWLENNQALGSLYLKGEGKILVVTDARGDSRDWETLVAALKASERAVQVRMSYELPRDALSLLSYDLIILPNAPAYGFDAVQLQALHDAVFNLGTGLIMLGSKETFGPGGYHGTVVEDALPVSMDVSQKKVLPKGALMIVLDRSGSMAMEVGGRTKLSLANRGAALALKALSAEDYFGVLAVDTQAHVVAPLEQHADRAEMEQKILALTPGGGGIYVYTSLQAAAVALRKVDAAVKHIILFSDAADAEEQSAGQEADGATGSTTAVDLVSALTAAKITTSVVALGSESDKDTAFLQAVAAAGKGRFYITADANTLPQLFVKEAMTLKRSMVQERTFVPLLGFPSPVLKGIDAMPPLHGYVLTTPKPTASVILQAPQLAEELKNGDTPDPVLAIWRYGLGTTAAWTSDLAPSWARDWMGWEKYRAFIKQLVTETSRVSAKSDLSLAAYASGAQGIITIEDAARGERYVELKARVSGPRNESREVTMTQIAPRRYQGQFPLWGIGRYQVAALGVASGGAGKATSEQAIGGFAVPYSPEYLRFKSDPILLEQIAQRTGGRVLTPSDLTLFTQDRKMHESSKQIFDWFLLALACLVPLDVGVRRVQLDWSVIAGWFGRGKKKESTGTMGALLQRKGQAQAAQAAVERPKPVIMPAPSPGVTPTAPPSGKPVVTATNEAKDKAEAAPQSTTERLLARKRGRQDADKE